MNEHKQSVIRVEIPLQTGAACPFCGQPTGLPDGRGWVTYVFSILEDGSSRMGIAHRVCAGGLGLRTSGSR